MHKMQNKDAAAVRKAEEKRVTKTIRKGEQRDWDTDKGI